MPLQNRVDPLGEIVRAPERGGWMGNRGLLHDAAQNIRRPYRLKAWLTCVLEFRGRKRTVMSPGFYTELFFMDEATALAAGHRPCFECRRPDYNRFKAAAEIGLGQALPTAGHMDALLHDQRIGADGSKRTWRSTLAVLPDGVMILLDGAAWLKWGGELHRWSAGGYTERRSAQRDEVEVLTPHLTVAALAAGYIPEVRLG